ncbi:MAG TPA: hypothetical protein V6D48_26040 [Oculatellaceae cyanobacterium]
MSLTDCSYKRLGDWQVSLVAEKSAAKGEKSTHYITPTYDRYKYPTPNAGGK